jgi:hypothetical protein
MALKARDKKHGNQIKAGIEGRLKGHSFESILSQSICDNATGLCVPAVSWQGHLYEGNPTSILVSYVLNHLGLKKVDSIKSYWLGGLATSGKGDFVLGHEGDRVKRSKSDILLEIGHKGKVSRIGVSVKTCYKPKPTNAQLFCSTAEAICNLFRRNGVNVSKDFETGFKMFCGDEGFRPVDMLGEKLKTRKSDPDRWFFEELPHRTRSEIEKVFTERQDDITRILLQLAYAEDPFPPQYVLHQRHSAIKKDEIPFAIFHIDELIELSRKYNGFVLKPYLVRKGRFKGDPNTHQAPRFGCIQFQRLGNKQNATQLQFNLEAGYFYKITSSENDS